MILVNQLMSAVLQLLVLTAVPWVWYVVRSRKAAGFLQWTGLKPASRTPAGETAAIFAGFVLVTLLPYWYLYRTGSLTYSGFTIDAYRQSGWSLQTVLVILVWAVVQTSLSEEIFFRGFLCKRFCEVWGWKTGTAIQAALFGAIHLPSVWEEAYFRRWWSFCSRAGLASRWAGSPSGERRGASCTAGSSTRQSTFYPLLSYSVFCFREEAVIWKKGTGRKSPPLLSRCW